jgi:phosphorylated adapter RNA export protein
LQKNLRHPKPKQEIVKGNNEETSSQTSTIVPEEEIELLDAHEPLASDVPPQEEMLSEPTIERKSVRDRMRLPITYDDLFEEGEIHD